MPRIDRVEVVSEHNLLLRNDTFEDQIEQIVRRLIRVLGLDRGCTSGPDLPLFGVDVHVVLTPKSGDFLRLVLVLVPVLGMDEVGEHVVKGVTASLWLFDVLRFHTEESGELLQGRRGLAVGEPEDGVDVPLFRNAVILPSNRIPAVLLILVMDNRVSRFDLATELFKTVYQIGPKAKCVTIQHGSVLWIRGPCPQIRLELLSEADQGWVVTLPAHRRSPPMQTKVM